MEFSRKTLLGDVLQVSNKKNLSSIPNKFLMDVCLVNMPYAGLERPSIGLGILEAYLKKDHRSFRSIYANLLFAEHIGLDAYYFIELSSNEDLLGEWTFGGLAFPEFSPDW